MAIDTEKLKKVLDDLKENKHFSTHFFSELSKKSQGHEALEEINNHNFFNTENEPKPKEDKDGYYSISHWAAINYLEKITFDKESDKNLIREIVENIITEKKSPEKIKNFHTAISIVIILSELLDKNFNFKDEYNTFIKNAFKSKYRFQGVFDGTITDKLIPKLLELNRATELEKILKTILEPKYSDVHCMWTATIDQMYLEMFLDKKETFSLFNNADLCIKTTDVIIEIIEEMTKKEGGFSIYQISAIEENTRDMPQVYEVLLIKFLRNILEKITDIEKINSYITKFLKEKHSIFKRLGFYLINYFYKKDNINKHFWDLKENPLIIPNVKHEIYELLKAHCIEFTDSEITKLLNWINSIDTDTCKDEKIRKENEKHFVSIKREWLSALKDSNYDEVQKLDADLSKISDSYFTPAGYYFWIGESVRGLQSSSYLELEKKLLESGGEEVVNHLNTLDEKKYNLWQEDENLELLVLKQPLKIIETLKIINGENPFIKLKLNFLHHLIFGLFRLFEGKDEYSFYSCLDFFLGILKNEKFWVDEDISNRNNIVKNIFEIIKKTNENNFKTGYENKFKEIFEKCNENLNNISEEKCGVQDDPLSHAINSAKGAFSEALLHYSFASSIKNDTWQDGFPKKLVEEILTNPFAQFAAIMGEKFIYFPCEWVYENINKIFSIQNDNCWYAAFYSFLFSSPYLHDKEFFNKLKEDGHYEKAIKRSYTEEEVQKKRLFNDVLIKHITNSYFLFDLSGDYNNSLIKIVIENKDFSQIYLLIHYMWGLRDMLQSEEKNKKVKEVFEKLCELIEQGLQEEKEEYKKLAAYMLILLGVFPNIDDDLSEKFEKLSEDIDYDLNNSLSHYLRYLEQLSSTNPKIAGKLFYKIHTSEKLRYYFFDDIKKIVSRYSKIDEDKSNKIRNWFFNKGETFLKDIQE